MSFDEAKAKEFMATCDATMSSMAETSRLLAGSWKFEEIRENLRKMNKDFVDIHFFGSRIIGVGTPESDLDIFIDTGGKFESFYMSFGEFDPRYDDLETSLTLSPDWTIQRKVLKTAVPIITAKYLPLDLICKFLSISAQSFHNEIFFQAISTSQMACQHETLSSSPTCSRSSRML